METKENSSQTSGQTRSDIREKEHQLLEKLSGVRAQEREIEDSLLDLQSQGLGSIEKPNGAAAAAIISGSIGVFVIGLLTTLAAASVGIKDFLNWYNPAGPLSGKTGLGVIVWLAAWAVTHYAMRNREVNFTRVVQLMIVLLAAGLLLMFPPIFELFE